jgi:uncharacterized protein (UPF0332 family)
LLLVTTRVRCKRVPEDYINRAYGALQDARILFQSGRAPGAANRAYYAMFYAARAVLAQIAGVPPSGVKTHRGLRRLFELHVVSAGLMDRAMARNFNEVQGTRIAADYGEDPVGLLEAEAALADAEAFVAACERIVESHKA